jgi:antitoxin component YwqK of YwqJK toxin-antitoxin module
MIGYKIAKNNGRKVTVTLEIPSDALTNMNRGTIILKETASYRTNKARVLQIEDSSGNFYQTAESFIAIELDVSNKPLVYTVGEIIEVPDYNTNETIVSAEGIHYFLSRHVAELQYPDKIPFSGPFESWYANGIKYIECEVVNGEPYGSYRSWHENATPHIETTYINEGHPHGTYKQWYKNGNKNVDGNFLNGKLHGHYIWWHENGQVGLDTTYMNGLLHGRMRIWGETGTLERDEIYDRGEFVRHNM